MTTARGSRQVLIHGLSFILAGLLWGLMIPHTPYPRLALGAHIQFEGSGVLLIIMSAWLTWAMALSEVGNAWWGTAQMLPIAAHQAGASGGLAWQEGVVKAAHIAAALGLIAAWVVLMVGFIRKAPSRTKDPREISVEQS